MGALRSFLWARLCVAVVVCLIMAMPPLAVAQNRTVRIVDSFFQDTTDDGDGSTTTSTVTAGATVTWTWGQMGSSGTGIGHTTTSGTTCCSGDGNWDSGNTGQKSGNFTPPENPFTVAGDYPYFCRVHGVGMSGLIRVNPGPLHHFKVTASVENTTSGNNFTVTVEAKDQFDNTVKSYAGTVSFTSTDPNATLPANSPNNTLVEGVRTFPGIILRTAGSQTITVKDVASPFISGNVPVNVNAGPATQLQLTTPASSPSGSALIATVTALDASNNVATSYGGTVRFTSSDPAATLPANTTLVSGARNFSITLITTGSRTLTVTDTANAALTDTNSINVTAAGCTTTFTNSASITINDRTTATSATATPYPSSIVVAGLKQVNLVAVTLNNLSHGFPVDIDVLVVGPTGKKMIIMSDTGNAVPVSGAIIKLDDQAEGLVPAPLVSGTFRPTNRNGNDSDAFAAPAPPGPYSQPAPQGTDTFASVFNGTDPNGTWNLYVVDDLNGDAGSIAGGWSLTFGASPNTFCNPASISIPSSGTSTLSTPYPSPVTVSGLVGTIKNVSVRLNNFSHTAPMDVDMLLVGPAGQKMIISSDVGGVASAVNAVVTFDDSAAISVPPTSLITSNLYRPTNFTSGDTFASPAPLGPYLSPAPAGIETFGSVFDGTNPNGTWNLYVVDDFPSLSGGSISGGWALSLDLFFNTTTALSSTPNPSTLASPVTFTATVSSSRPETPTGLVIFRDGAVSLGSSLLNAGVATFSTPLLALGSSHSITAQYLGDANFASSTSPALTQVVLASPTNTVLNSSPNPSVFGQPVTLTATVNETVAVPGSPTGTVTFLSDGASIGSGVINANGVATLTTSALSGGNRILRAVFGSSTPNFAISASAPRTQFVNAANTSTTVVSSGPSTFGNSITFTATVSESTIGIPTGLVKFKDGPTEIGTAELNDVGVAAFSTSQLPIPLTTGTHSITATYVGDGDFGPSTSPAFTQIVNKSTPTVLLISLDGGASTFGQSTGFRAVLNPADTTTGTVTFKDGETNLGTANLVSGIADFSTSALAGGSHTISAVYNGDNNFNSATGTATHQVSPADSSTSLTSSLNPSTFGQSVIFTATVISSAGTPGGEVTFFRDGVVLAKSPMNASGVATAITSALSAGSRTITAHYNGSANFADSDSVALTQTVNKANTTIALISTRNPASFGQPVTFRATLTSSTGATVAGSVTFSDGAATLGSSPLSGGVASLTTSTLQNGAHDISAVYAGNTNFNGSAPASLVQMITQAGTNLSLVANKDTSVRNEAVTFTIIVTSTTTGVPTGTVTFLDGTNPLGTFTLNGSGQASITLDRLTIGRHGITVEYNGDVNFPSNTSSSLVHYRSPKPLKRP